ncbi:MAG: hypothetical protein LBB73_02785 [Dysgonamonadaceae bacterium]|jgi:hypothetical protein|nr:hypothetical protein [Dysgonamonadaceae bacterium]
MHTEKLIKLMHGDAQYDKKTLSGLSKIIRKYPYFQSAHLLYTLNLFHLKHPYFPSELRKTATYLNDRKKLFFLVENRFFDSDKIETLQHEIPQNTGILIDSFLSQREETPKKVQNSSAVSTDYINRYLLEDREETPETPKPLQFQDMIDRFLEQDGISPVKIELADKPVESAETTGETSGADSEQSGNDGFVSETLAKIYIKQRKYDKALEIIHKIVLHYPEKSSYFADRIQMLEDLISSNK